MPGQFPYPRSQVLTGSDAERALSALDDIATDLQNEVECRPRSGATWDPIGDRLYSLSGGWAGIAVFFSYLDQFQPEHGFDEVAVEALELALAGLNEPSPSNGLFLGFPGIAWAFEHLKGRVAAPECRNYGDEIAEAVGSWLETAHWRHDFDLVSGLVGLAVYGLERDPSRRRNQLVRRVVEHLESLATSDEQGIAWFTVPTRLPSHLRESCPEGCFDLGMAHGVPGVVALLARVCLQSCGGKTCKALLRRSVKWLGARCHWDSPRSKFSLRWLPTPMPTPSVEPRIAWCYGDLGVAFALLAAGLSLADAEITEQAYLIAKNAGSRGLEPEPVAHPGLCHGAAGNAHLFNRLYQISGAGEFGDASLLWYRHLLGLRKPGHGLGGFTAHIALAGGQMAWHADPGLLTGTAGIGLSLIAGLNSSLNQWDRLLLLPQLQEEPRPARSLAR